jgi:hypothetical protein
MSSPAPAPAEQSATIPTTLPVPQEEAVAAPDKLEATQARSRVTSESTWSRLANDVIAAAELAEELEKDLDAIRGELADVRKAQRRAEQERDEAVEARFTARTVLEAVELAGACFPRRPARLRFVIPCGSLRSSHYSPCSAAMMANSRLRSKR